VDKGGGLDAGISALPFVKSLTRASASANASFFFNDTATTEIYTE